MIAFDLPTLKAESHSLEQEMAEPGFWEDRSRSKNVSQRLEAIKSKTRAYESLHARLEDLEVLLELAREEDDEDALEEISPQAEALAESIDELELETFLNGPHDGRPCYFEINAGAGGTDAQDWAEMLLRMYVAWFEKRGFRYRLLEASPGEVAGLKSAMAEIDGPYAYGYLKGEQGVHRLVRISPFDANGRRHTSFAAVSVIPVIENPDVEVRSDDLKIDTYRAGGAGGQHVNKTDSAVRITHLPTGIVVACQKERSQHQNKEIAMQVLLARLHELKEREHEAELKGIQGEQKRIEWGSQIRSYVFAPYQLVKDHRTDVETGNVDAVMDGALDPFIEANVRMPSETR